MSRRLSWETGRTLARAIALGASNGFITWRWLLAGVAFAFATVASVDALRFGFEDAGLHRSIDMWDFFPGMLLLQLFLTWLFAFGFLLLVGDSYLRERERGAVTLCALRLPSRTLYWLSKMGALAVLAVGFVGLGLAVTLLVGLLIAPPFTAPLFAREGMPGMYPWAGLFVPAYLLLLAGYTAWALWLQGCAVVLLSVFIPRKATVPVAIAVWAGTSLPLLSPHSWGYARLLMLDYFVCIAKHDASAAAPMSWHAFFTLGAVAAVLMAVAGSWRLRWEEL